MIFAVLAFPFGANLDTGNINLQLTLMLWAAQFTVPWLSGLLWAIATWMKWVPVVFWPILRAAGAAGASAGCAVSIALSLVTLPLTIIQLQVLFGFGARPVRLDYLVYLWAVVPWLYRRPDPFDFLRPATWRRWVASGALRATGQPAGSRRRSWPAIGGVLAPPLVDRSQEERPDHVEAARDAEGQPRPETERDRVADSPPAPARRRRRSPRRHR